MLIFLFGQYNAVKRWMCWTENAALPNMEAGREDLGNYWSGLRLGEPPDLWSNGRMVDMLFGLTEIICGLLLWREFCLAPFLAPPGALVFLVVWDIQSIPSNPIQSIQPHVALSVLNRSMWGQPQPNNGNLVQYSLETRPDQTRPDPKS